jgi:hypothetical protein
MGDEGAVNTAVLAWQTGVSRRGEKVIWNPDRRSLTICGRAN